MSKENDIISLQLLPLSFSQHTLLFVFFCCNFEIAIDKHWENQEMKYNHNADIELKTRRNRSYTTIQRDDDKVEADKVVDDQHP